MSARVRGWIAAPPSDRAAVEALGFLIDESASDLTVDETGVVTLVVEGPASARDALEAHAGSWAWSLEPLAGW